MYLLFPLKVKRLIKIDEENSNEIIKKKISMKSNKIKEKSIFYY